jgi:putative SOS response-associated peptidase YedK
MLSMNEWDVEVRCMNVVESRLYQRMDDDRRVGILVDSFWTWEGNDKRRKASFCMRLRSG